MHCDFKKFNQEENPFLVKLRELDFKSLVDRIINKYEWSREKTLGLMTLYQMFLFLLYLYPHKTIVPPVPEVDLIWHEHILNTPKYMNDSRILFGRYVHHVPAYSLPIEAQKQAEHTWSETLDLWLQHFGDETLGNIKFAVQSEKNSSKQSPVDCIHPPDPA